MYDAFYQFTARPFQLTPDPAFYFETATHRKALSYLGYGLAQGEGFIVITGEIGAGKSTLAAHLLASIDRERLTAAQIVTSALDAGELAHMAARAFGLTVPDRDKAGALARLEAFLGDEARAGRRCLLVVDEAQTLSIEALEELRMLSNFQLGAHPLLQILLLGQPEFRTLLKTAPGLEQLRQRVIATHHLGPMEPAEVGPYVEHRLACAGWHGNPAFDPRAYAELARASGGVPRRLNQLVNRLLLLGAVEQRTQIDAAMVRTVVADLAGDGAGDSAGASAPLMADVPADVAPVLAPDPLAEPAVGAADSRPVHDDLAEPVFADAPAGDALPIDPHTLAAAFAARDEQIAELQHAVIELAEMRWAPEGGAPATGELATVVEALAARIDALEARGAEQEQAIRHALTTLIEWIESETPARAAA